MPSVYSIEQQSPQNDIPDKSIPVCPKSDHSTLNLNNNKKLIKIKINNPTVNCEIHPKSTDKLIANNYRTNLEWADYAIVQA